MSISTLSRSSSGYGKQISKSYFKGIEIEDLNNNLKK